MKLNRKDFLLNMGCAAAGAALGAIGQHQLSGAPAAAPGPVAQAQPTPAEPKLTDPGPPVNPANSSPDHEAEHKGMQTFAQCGEDVIVYFMLRHLGIKDVNYLDVGAFHPIEISNTYFFYSLGYHGVLVEPNVAMCEELRKVRPKDKTLEAGIGVTSVREADYYVMTNPAWNTFSKEEAEHEVEATKGRVSIKEIRKMPLLDINSVMDTHFKGAPAFLSIDAEGLHLAILKSIDFKRFRPKIICAETLVSATNRSIPEIPAFMETQGYVERGKTFVNSIFVDSEIL
jgi:hypothetical protein